MKFLGADTVIFNLLIDCLRRAIMWKTRGIQGRCCQLGFLTFPISKRLELQDFLQGTYGSGDARRGGKNCSPRVIEPPSVAWWPVRTSPGGNSANIVICGDTRRILLGRSLSRSLIKRVGQLDTPLQRVFLFWLFSAPRVLFDPITFSCA